MSTPVIPLIIRGSGCVLFNSAVYYWTDKLTIKATRPTFEVPSDFFGNIDTRAGGGAMVDIEFTPVGQIAGLVKYYPYGPSNLVAASSVGNSILGGALVIATKAGQTITYSRAGIYKSPTLQLSPRKTAFGPMTFRAMNKITVPPTDAAALKAIASASFTDASFDPTKIVSDVYTASIGERSAPFDAVGARNGFELEPVYKIEDAQDDNVGVADAHLTDITWKLRFAPNNLTEAQVDSLAMWQGADAILSGESVARGPGSTPEDIIVDADFLTATIHKVGVVTAEGGYGVKVDRNGNLEFAQQMSFTAGAPDPLVTLTLN
jgi:hypothetical protein